MKLGRVLLLGIVLGAITLFIGCPEAEQMVGPVVDTTEPGTNGEVKPEETPVTEPTEPTEQPEPTTEPEEPSQPTPPADTTPPTVVEVAWYSDWQLTEAITDDVRSGDTIYTIVVFSEAMLHTIADDASARPALSIMVDGIATRYRMAAHGASGNAFASGSAKPLGGGTDDYLCKYTIPADASGTLALHVGNATADLAGNIVAEISEHLAPFVVAKPVVEPPIVTEPEDLVDTTPPVEPPSDPDPMEITPVEVGSEYTFTLEGEVYPGYNPSPGVQHVLDTHPSAQLPFFEEAVKMTEVSDWVYREVWTVYPDWETNPASVDKMVTARIAVKEQFGLTQRLDATFEQMYIDFLGYLPQSYYWFFVECFRLLLEHQKELRSDHYTIAEYDHLQYRFRESLEKGHIVGQINPNN